MYTAGTRAFVGGGGSALVDEEEDEEEEDVTVVVEAVGFGCDADVPEAGVWVDVTDVDDVVMAVVAMLEGECLEPPHPAASSEIVNTTERGAVRFTFSA